MSNRCVYCGADQVCRHCDHMTTNLDALDDEDYYDGDDEYHEEYEEEDEDNGDW